MPATSSALLCALSCWLLVAVAAQCQERCNTTCATFVMVDSSLGSNCGSSGNLAGMTCDSLQHVLESISMGRTAHQPGDCVEVYVASGRYSVTTSVTIAQSVVLRGEYDSDAVSEGASSPTSGRPPPGEPQEASPFATTVAFEMEKRGGSGESALYAVNFTSADQVAIVGLKFSTSPRIIGFDNVVNVTVLDCIFSEFSQGAIDIYNCLQVVVQNCNFNNNGPADVIKQEQYRGHSAGLSIAYNYYTPLPVSPSARVLSSTFYNNRANVTKNFFSTTQVLEELKFPGQGGAMSLIINGLTPVEILVEDCLIEDNFATVFGAGIYTLLDGFSHHIITIRGCRICDNVTPGSAGGLEIGFRETGNSTFVNSVFVSDTNFTGNTATYGGGAFFLVLGTDNDKAVELGNFAQFKGCVFDRNTATDGTGAAFAAAAAVLFESRELVRPVELIDCSFINNDVLSASGGVVNVAYLPVAFYGSSVIRGSRGPAVSVQGAVVEVHGSLSLVDNAVLTDGGALYLLSFGQVRLFPNATVSFMNNNGSLGAAMVIEAQRVPPIFSTLIFNPLCSLIFSDSRLPPLQWHNHNVSVLFSGNEADVGSAVYLNQINLCSWENLTPPYFKPKDVFRWNFMQFYTNNSNRAHSPNDTAPIWYVQSPAKSIQVEGVEAWPGEEINLEIMAMDEFNETTAVGMRLSSNTSAMEESGNPDTELFQFSPSTFIHTQLNESTVKTSFSQRSSTNDNQGSILAESILSQETTSFLLNVNQCPPGRTLTKLASSSFSSCQCNLDNPSIVDCDRALITLNHGLWATVDRSQGGDSLFTYPCPSGYCHCKFKVEQEKTVCIPMLDSSSGSSNSNRQCQCNRAGTLCGSCEEGRGVSALLNTCKTCSNVFALLIGLLVLVDVVIMLLILLPMVALPIWTYPCIFYLQILPYLTEHFPVTFEKFRPYLYYISSAVGFYYPYDFCLYGQMSPLVAYTLRYIPFFVAVVVSLIVLVIRRLKFRPAPLHGLWWVFVLLFTPTLFTSFSILNCPTLTTTIPGTSSTSASAHWFIDGSVRCFTGGHIGLAVLAMLVVLFLLVTLPCVCIIALELIEKFWLPRHMVRPIQRGFTHKWWGVVELSRRILILVFIIAFPGNDYPVIYVLAVVLVVYGYVQPYKQRLVNWLEVIMCIDVLLMMLLRNVDQLIDEWQSLPPQSQSTQETIRRQAMMMPSGADSQADCSIIEGVTPLASTLSAFYYFPLLLSIVAAMVWVTAKTRNYLKAKELFRQKTPPPDEPAIPKENRRFTTTIVDITELEASPASPTGEAGAAVVRKRSKNSLYDKFRRWQGSKRKSGKKQEQEVDKALESTMEVTRTHTSSVVTMEHMDPAPDTQEGNSEHRNNDREELKQDSCSPPKETIM